MSQYEFLNYEPDVENKILGVVTIRAWGKIILRFKAVMRKDGSSWFLKSAGSVKNGFGQDGKDHYDDAFMLDSNYEMEQISKFIRQNVNPIANFGADLTTNAQNQATPMQHIYSRGNAGANTNFSLAGNCAPAAPIPPTGAQGPSDDVPF